VSDRPADHPLSPALAHTELQLQSALEEVCVDDIAQRDTDELIRIEETLAGAAEAAKQAVSLRRRINADA
jgi:hypothetical protein